MYDLYHLDADHQNKDTRDPILWKVGWTFKTFQKLLLLLVAVKFTNIKANLKTSHRKVWCNLMPLLNVLTKNPKENCKYTERCTTWKKHRDFSVIAMVHKTQIGHSFLWRTIKRWLEDKQKEKEQTERQKKAERRWWGTHLLYHHALVPPNQSNPPKSLCKRQKERKRKIKCHAGKKGKCF